MKTATTRFMVMELTAQGAQTRYFGQDLAAARALYESLRHATLTERHGLDVNGQMVPGKVCDNLTLGRRLHGVETVAAIHIRQDSDRGLTACGERILKKRDQRGHELISRSRRTGTRRTYVQYEPLTEYRACVTCLTCRVFIEAGTSDRAVIQGS